MNQAASPTVLLPIGKLGEATLVRIRKTLGTHDPKVREHRVIDGPDALRAIFGDLLQVGQTPRLDVLVFADATEGLGSELQAACAQVSEVLKQHFSRVFPVSATPEQRGAALHVVLYTPALTDAPDTHAVLKRVGELLSWNESAPHPTLARIWLAAQQTAAGVLSATDLVSQGSGFALALLGAGIRNTDAVQRRLAHPAPGMGRLGFLAVGTLDLPLGRVESWARVRSAYAAMERLVERTAVGEGRIRGLEPEALDRWIAPFDTGPEAQALKNAAWKLAGGAEIPDRITLGPLDGRRGILDRYAGLFAEPDAAEGSSTAVTDALSALDRSHAEVVAGIHSTFDGPFAGRLGEVRPLADLPALEFSLEQFRRRLVTRATAAPPVAAVDMGPDQEVLMGAISALPSPGALRMLGLAVALAVGFMVLGVTTGVLLRPPPAAAAGMTTGVRTTGPQTLPLTASHVVPWIAGGLIGGVAGLGVMFVAGRRSRAGLLELLKQRAEALRNARSSGLAIGPSAKASERLALHRQRIRNEASRAVESAQQRVQTIRGALIQCRAALGQQLDSFGVPVSRVPDAEDLSNLFEAETPFHAPLLGADATRDWVRRARRFADDDVLADHIVDGSMPRDGLQVDVPASAPDQVLELAAVQTRTLLETSLFDDPAAAAEITERAEAFARRVGTSLEPGCRPMRSDGLPEPGVRAGSTFVVGPSDGRTALENALARSQAGIHEQYWTPSAAPLVLFVRTWEGYQLDQIERGARG